MKILITGGTGFVGSALTRHYLNAGHELIITGTRTEQPIPDVKLLECSFIGLDWRAIKNIDMVFHQSANNSTTCLDTDEMLKANYYAPIELFQKCYNAGCRKFVYASSTAIYGNGPTPYQEDQSPEPLTPYAKSKLLFEHWATEFAKHNKDITTCVGLRYCNVYGPGEEHKGKRASMIHQLIQQIGDGVRPRLFKNGDQKRDWIYIEDVVKLNALAANYQGADVFNCGTGKAVSFNELVSLINKEIEINNETLYIDNPNADMYQSHTECSIRKAETILGFQPSWTVQKAIPDFIDYYRCKFNTWS